MKPNSLQFLIVIVALYFHTTLAVLWQTEYSIASVLLLIAIYGAICLRVSRDGYILPDNTLLYKLKRGLPEELSNTRVREFLFDSAIFYPIALFIFDRVYDGSAWAVASATLVIVSTLPIIIKRFSIGSSS